MNNKPLISIITVNLNNLEGLKTTMKSVFAQTWQEFEYVIIDGGSIDGSKEYISENNSKIDYWISEKDTGIYNGMNKGIKVSKGEYLLFLNSGDHFSGNNALQNNYKAVNNFDLIYFNYKVISPGKDQIVSYPKILGFTDLFYGTLCHQCVCIKRDLFKKVGEYDENLKIVADWKFFILALFHVNCSYKKVGNVLSVFYANGMSADPRNEQLISEERQTVLKEYFGNFIAEVNELQSCRETIKNLRRSKKINLLIKLGLLNKF